MSNNDGIKKNTDSFDYIESFFWAWGMYKLFNIIYKVTNCKFLGYFLLEALSYDFKSFKLVFIFFMYFKELHSTRRLFFYKITKFKGV